MRDALAFRPPAIGAVAPGDCHAEPSDLPDARDGVLVDAEALSLDDARADELRPIAGEQAVALMTQQVADSVRDCDELLERREEGRDLVCSMLGDRVDQLFPARPIVGDRTAFMARGVDHLRAQETSVLHGELAGVAQYNEEGPDDRLSATELDWIRTHREGWAEAPPAYALDVGRLSSGVIALVEVNDAWGTGYYPSGTFSAKQCANGLLARWRSFPQERR